MSNFIERRLSLRDGHEYLLRTLRDEDSAAMRALERDLIAAQEGVVKYEDELADEETYAAQLKKRSEAKGALQIVAERDGVIVGEASLTRFPLRMLRHVGLLGLGVHPEAQGVGLGRALFESMIDWARAQTGDERILRLELYTRADNHRAIKLYQSLGFVIEGTRRGFIKQADGSLLDDFVMGLLLSPAQQPTG